MTLEETRNQAGGTGGINMHAKKLAVVALSFTALTAGAQEFPTRSVRMIVPFAPSGPNDVLGRILAQKLSERMGQQVIIENRSGAGGSTGTAAVAVAPADGYTLLFSGTSSLAINPSLYKKLPYNAIKDFAPVSLAGTAPSLLATHLSVPAKTVKELIAIAKTSPGKLNYGSGGIGGTPHLASELFKSLANINIVHVPFRGAGPALVALVSGQVDIYIGGISSILPMVRDRRIRPIAVTSAKRTALLPEMPTFIESGVPGYEVVNWYAVVAPALTPRPVISKLNTEIVNALAAPDVTKRFADLGTDAASSTPEQLGAYHREDLARWEKVIKVANIQPE
jgi:tripartite-type tricarboxylate transporter receptor subunit TctC